MKPESEIETAPVIVFLWKIACLMPPVSLVLLYSFVIRVRLDIGFWPWYANPDPMQTGFVNHATIVGVSLLLTLLSPVGIIVLWLFCMSENYRRHRKRIHVSMIFFLVLYFAWFILLYFDPGSFLDWFLD